MKQRSRKTESKRLISNLLKCADKSLKALESTVNLELSIVCEWLTVNKLSICIFHPYQKRLNHKESVKIYVNHTNKK